MSHADHVLQQFDKPLVESAQLDDQGARSILLLAFNDENTPEPPWRSEVIPTHERRHGVVFLTDSASA